MSLPKRRRRDRIPSLMAVHMDSTTILADLLPFHDQLKLNRETCKTAIVPFSLYLKLPVTIPNRQLAPLLDHQLRTLDLSGCIHIIIWILYTIVFNYRLLI